MSLFGTAGIRGPVSEVTPELAVAVGRAAGVFGRVEAVVVGQHSALQPGAVGVERRWNVDNTV